MTDIQDNRLSEMGQTEIKKKQGWQVHEKIAKNVPNTRVFKTK